MSSNSVRAWIITFAVVTVTLGGIVILRGRVAAGGRRDRSAATGNEQRNIRHAEKGRAGLVRNNADAPPRESASGHSDTRRHVLVQRASDFTGARFGDAVVTDALRLRDVSGRAARSEAGVGSYFSAVDDRPMSPEEQMDATFDQISFDCDADIPAGAAVKLEFRTIAYDEDGEGWSGWHEVRAENFNRLIPLGALAQKWQYRLTLAGRDDGSSPVVRSVTVLTERDPELAAKAFAFAEHAP